jgi:hypothetical protein
MLVNELNVDLSSPESCFQAESAEECFVALRQWRSTQRDNNLTISSAVRVICSQPHSDTERLFVNLSVLNMFTIVSGMPFLLALATPLIVLALYTLTFHAVNSPLLISDCTQIKTGLQNWSRLWPSPCRDAELAHAQADTTIDRWKGVGFMRHAPEYWLLTQMIVNRAQSRAVMALTSNPSSDESDMTRLNCLIGEFRAAKQSSI